VETKLEAIIINITPSTTAGIIFLKQTPLLAGPRPYEKLRVRGNTLLLLVFKT
jgi:hypothetical protein